MLNKVNFWKNNFERVYLDGAHSSADSCLSFCYHTELSSLKKSIAYAEKLNVLKPAVLALSCFFSSQILAEVQHIYPDQAFLESGITIIDIRTQGEWMETGFVEGALPLTFFDEQGHYDAARFIHHLDQLVDRDQTIALICRTGNRTRIISEFLATQGFEVINLKGGIYRLMSQGYIPVDYGQRQAEIQASQQCPQIEIC